MIIQAPNNQIVNNMNKNIENYQQYLNQMSFDSERMSILQRQTGGKIQSLSRNNKQYIKSTSDIHQDLRILIFSLLIKIYSDTMIMNEQWQQKFKQIIYHSDLLSITLYKGLLKEQLHKIIYQNLQELREAQRNEQKMLRMFNNAPFFDQVIMSSIKNYFEVEKYQSLSFWQQTFVEYFDIVILVKDQNLDNVKEDQMNSIVIQQEQNVVLYQLLTRQSKIHRSKSKEGSQLSFASDSFGNFTTFQKNQQLLASCQSVSSPTLQKQNYPFQNRLACSRQIADFKSIELSPVSSRSRKSRNIKKQSSSFWALFCCGD